MANEWRVAEALIKLRDQVNAAWPERSKVSDGTIGDERHATTDSDHNPWVRDGGIGVVTALDITHDPDNGPDCNRLAQALIASRDRRIKYVIWNRRIISSYQVDGVPAWQWRAYDGSNPHDHHLHISVKSTKIYYDATDPWKITLEDDVTSKDIETIADRVVEKLLNRRLVNPKFYAKGAPTATLQTWLTYRLARTDDLRAEAAAIRAELAKLQSKLG